MYAETRFCNACGQPVEFRIPEGDHQPRHVCGHCGHVQYRNPKVIAGVILEAADGRVLMCRRDIEPRRGLWTFPAGFLEQGETSAQGAAREALEESQAEAEPGPLFMVINVPYVSQVYMIHRAALVSERFGPTPESSEVRLMREDEIPWDEIAFPTIWHSLRQYFADRRAGTFRIHELDLLHRPRPPQRAEIPGMAP